MQRVFVYGTLKEDFPNFPSNKGMRVAGSFITLDSYPLYLVGERYVPWLMLNAGNGHRVRGELYKVSNEALLEMDALEQVTEPEGYQRVELEVVCEETSASFSAHAYVKNNDQLHGVEIRKRLEGEYTMDHAALFSRRDS